jgi:hypothetical protein
MTNFSNSASDFFSSSPPLHCKEGTIYSSDFASIVFSFPSLHVSSETSEESEYSISDQSWDDDCDSDSSSITSASCVDDSSITTSASYADELEEKNGEKESHYVFFLRLGIVTVLLLAAAAAVAVIVYFITDNVAMGSFESHYEAAAGKVTGKLTKYHVHAMLCVTMGESLTITNHSICLRSSGNFMDIAQDKMGAAGSSVVVIVSNFQERAASAVTKLSGAQDKMVAAGSLVVAIVSNFQERAATVVRLSVALYIWMNPGLSDELREECASALSERPSVQQSLRGFDVFACEF